MMKLGLCLLLGLALAGCHAPQKDEPAPQQPKTVQKTELKSQSMTEEEIAHSKEVIEKMRKEGRLIPPASYVEAEVLDTNKISQDDAERSFLFRKPAIHHCYMNALAENGVFNGKYTLRLKNTGTPNPEVSEVETDVPESMAKCVATAVERWPVPDGADFKVSLVFTARERTIDELRLAIPDDGHDHHHHHHNGDEDHDDTPLPVPADE